MIYSNKFNFNFLTLKANGQAEVKNSHKTAFSCYYFSKTTNYDSIKRKNT